MGCDGALRLRRAAILVLSSGVLDPGRGAERDLSVDHSGCVYIWIALVPAGASMFVLARRWLGRRDAIFAAALYAVNPYHLVIVYWRSAFAELLASCLLPLLLLLVLKAAEGERRVIVPLALVLAAAWLTNAPAAVMMHYSLALLIVFFAWQQRSPRFLAGGSGRGRAGRVPGGVLSASGDLRAEVGEHRRGGGRRDCGRRTIFFSLTRRMRTTMHFNRLVSWVALAGDRGDPCGAVGGGKMWRAKFATCGMGWLVWAAACSALMFLDDGASLEDSCPSCSSCSFRGAGCCA